MFIKRNSQKNFNIKMGNNKSSKKVSDNFTCSRILGETE